MRADASVHPLEVHNKLSKSQQRLFTFILQRCNNQNQHRITGVEISEQMEISTQLVSHDIKALVDSDIVRKGKHSILMVNPYLWFFGERYERLSAVELWEALPKTINNNDVIVGFIKRYR
jgi:predicted transcriptional regulator